MKYNTVLFDLDGTLTDSGAGIMNSVVYSLSKFQIQVTDKTELNKFIGPPLQDSFMKCYGFDKEETRQAIEWYREYFKRKGMFENQVYSGIEELLIELQKADKKIIVATSKAEPFAREILDYFHLSQYFTYIAGANMDGTRSKKAEVIAYALEQGKVSDLSKVVMVGDREQDIIGAKHVGIDSIGVLYGYGSREELEKAGATYIAKEPEDILPYIN